MGAVGQASNRVHSQQGNVASSEFEAAVDVAVTVATASANGKA